MLVIHSLQNMPNPSLLLGVAGASGVAGGRLFVTAGAAVVPSVPAAGAGALRGQLSPGTGTAKGHGDQEPAPQPNRCVQMECRVAGCSGLEGMFKEHLVQPLLWAGTAPTTSGCAESSVLRWRIFCCSLWESGSYIKQEK